DRHVHPGAPAQPERAVRHGRGYPREDREHDAARDHGTPMTETNEIHPTLRKLKIPALLVGIVGLALWIVGIFLAGDDSHLRDRTFLSYTYAWFVGIGLPMGAMGLLMIQHLSGG